MSTRHLLDNEGVVACDAAARPDGGNVTSDLALVSCSDCQRADVVLNADEAGLVREAVEFYLGRVNFSTGDEAEVAYRALLTRVIPPGLTP